MIHHLTLIHRRITYSFNSHSFLTLFSLETTLEIVLVYSPPSKFFYLFFFRKPSHRYIVTQYNHSFVSWQRHSVAIRKEDVASSRLPFLVLCVGFSRFYFLLPQTKHWQLSGRFDFSLASICYLYISVCFSGFFFFTSFQPSRVLKAWPNHHVADGRGGLNSCLRNADIEEPTECLLQSVTVIFI